MAKPFREVQRRIHHHLQHTTTTRTRLRQIHAQIIRHNLHQSTPILTQFITVCGTLHQISYAHSIFLNTQYPNHSIFNSLIKAYSLSSPSKEPLHLFSLMKTRGIYPDQLTFAPLLKCCTNISNLNFGKRVHAEIIRVGFESFNSVQIGLVELYTGCDRIEDAKRMFDVMLHRDVVVWNIMIRGLCRKGNVEMGVELFGQMNERSIVTWNTMIAGLAQGGRYNEALQIFHEMQKEGFDPDDATLVTVLPLCGRLGNAELGSWIHSYACSRRLFPKIVQVGNSILDFYFKCGDVETASRVFDEMPRKSVVSWNTMICGLGHNGMGKVGVEVFEEMRRQRVDLNHSTFVGALSCCVHAGMVEKGREFFNLMVQKCRLKPRIEHYGCMVDLLGRAGCIKEAQELIISMPMKPNAAIWGALLSACRTHGDLELAECAAKELIHLEPWNSGNYILLSNIYAELGKWHDVENTRVLMKEKQIVKVTGQSKTG
ncbi:hypothetical protein ACHQM5_026981 [Ranunculus cassubicifolius]